jgi:hypothetical protein
MNENSQNFLNYVESLEFLAPMLGLKHNWDGSLYELRNGKWCLVLNESSMDEWRLIEYENKLYPAKIYKFLSPDELKDIVSNILKDFRDVS